MHPIYIAGLMMSGVDYVIGLSDTTEENTFVWSDGTYVRIISTSITYISGSGGHQSENQISN